MRTYMKKIYPSSKLIVQVVPLQSSRSVMSDSLRPHGPQHTRPPCPSPTPRVHSDSCPLSRWGHPTISSSVIPFSSCLQSFPASGSFQMSQLFTSGGQSIGVSGSTSVLPVNIQDWSPLGWTGWISLQSKGLSRVFSNTKFKASFLWRSAFFTVQLSHLYMTTGRTIALIRQTFVGKVMSLLFNMLSELVIAYLPRSKALRCLLVHTNPWTAAAYLLNQIIWAWPWEYALSYDSKSIPLLSYRKAILHRNGFSSKDEMVHYFCVTGHYFCVFRLVSET